MGKLTKHDLGKTFRYYMTMIMAMQSMERFQAPPFASFMGKLGEKFYPGDIEKQKTLMKRHTLFFNSHPVGAMIPAGLALGMEEERAEGKDVPDELINNTKTALMGPLAGMGDSLIDGTYLPIILSIALGLTGPTGNILGPLFYIAVYWLTVVPLAWFFFKRAYSSGINGVMYLMQNGLTEKAVQAATVIGLVVVGCISAQYVGADFAWVFQSGDLSVNIGAIINGIFPKSAALILTLLAYWLIKKKHVSMMAVFVIFIGIAIIAYFTKFLA
ncbi:MAG: PTS system mannose/fructose/sorbose family transporter subunit IID [Treponema sp.]|jgi:PTS system mannose-specific IID component|nr:PTS system mannose/fructose/sorbose family transporter subunit IID [Treponema sp.]